MRHALSIAIVALSLLSVHCGAVGPCQIGRTSLEVAISATQPAVAAIPDDERREEAIVYLGAAQRIANALVDGCDSIEGADYLQLFGESTRLLGGVLAILEQSGVRIPPALRAVLEAFGTKGALPVLDRGGQDATCSTDGGDRGGDSHGDGVP